MSQCGLGPLCCLAFLLVAALGGSQGFLAQLANFGGAALMLGESTSIAAGQALNLTGVVASSASEVVTAATTNGLTAAANAWHGVDILGLEAQRCTALLTLDGREVLEEWFNQPFAATMVPCLTDEVRNLLLATLDSISLGMPTTKTGTEVVNLASRFDSISVWGQLLPNGKVQVTFEMIALRYSLAWSNPLWENLQMDVQTERPQILRSLRMTLLDLPQPSPSRQQPALELEVAVSWPLVRARIRVWLRKVLLGMTSWLFEETSRGVGAVNEWCLFVCILGLPWCIFAIVLWHGLHTRRHGQCNLAILDGDPGLPGISEEPPEELSGISDVPSAASDGSQSQPKSAVTSGSFQVVDAIEVSDDEASTNSSAYSMLLAVGPGGGWAVHEWMWVLCFSVAATHCYLSSLEWLLEEN